MSRLLAVDDEPINLAIIQECLSEDGYQIDEAADGEEAWALLQENAYDLILLDRMMPKLDGLSLLRRMKADPRWLSVPVIMQTAAARQEDVREGLEAGAHYYLTKPYDPEALQILVKSVLADIGERSKLREIGKHLELVFNLIDSGEFTFRTLEEARSLAAILCRLCADSAASAMGLSELLINAVEHGNLGITYKEKAELRANLGWEQEVERRLGVAPWADRQAHVSVRRDGEAIEFIITDQGAGFDWKPFLDFAPERAFDLNGRGIAMARMMGFASLEYQGSGNRVVARGKVGLR